ncbi:MAG TPA: hypothetical protein VGJ56_14450 [Reyranella sp.]
MNLQKYREKWHEVPGGNDEALRRFTTDLVNQSDGELLVFWDDMAVRRDASPLGFLQPLYRDFLRDRHTMDVGSGLGLDGMRFAMTGARWTFADIAPSNLDLLKRTRWEKEGRPAFETWGAMTDGERTPWSEWYDLDKLRQRLVPEKWRTLLDFDFQGTNFHWFDLQRLG